MLPTLETLAGRTENKHTYQYFQSDVKGQKQNNGVDSEEIRVKAALDCLVSEDLLK